MQPALFNILGSLPAGPTFHADGSYLSRWPARPAGQIQLPSKSPGSFVAARAAVYPPAMTLKLSGLLLQSFFFKVPRPADASTLEDGVGIGSGSLLWKVLGSSRGSPPTHQSLIVPPWRSTQFRPAVSSLVDHPSLPGRRVRPAHLPAAPAPTARAPATGQNNEWVSNSLDDQCVPSGSSSRSWPPRTDADSDALPAPPTPPIHTVVPIEDLSPLVLAGLLEARTLADPRLISTRLILLKARRFGL